MKHFKHLTFASIFLGLSISIFPVSNALGQKPASARKWALIVAIGDYDRSTGWAKISSEKDVPLVKGALTKIGFDEKNIAVLQDASATREGILSALKQLGSRVGPGDMVVIHFSSHGQQISDNNTPPEEADGYDEAIIAYGAPAGDRHYNNMTRGSNAGPYDGRYHLRDEELGAAIDGIRSTIGKDGHVLVTLDACHSGSGTRGSSIARGGEPPYDLQGAPKPSGEEEEGGFGIKTESKNNLGKFILISGAQAAEVNYETKDDEGNGVGSLSYCFSKALPTMDSKSTYRQLFARILSEMAEKAPKQTPQIEGDVDAEIFGSGFTPQPRFFKAKKIIDTRHLLIDAGTMGNAGAGTKVTIKSNLDGSVLTTGKVIQASNFEGTVELDGDLKETKAVNLQIHINNYSLTVKRVVVSLDSISNKDLKTALAASLTEMGMVDLSAKKSDLNVSDKSSRSGLFTVNINTTAYGTRLMNKPVSNGSLEKVVKDCSDLIQNYAQGNTFKSLDMKDDNYRVEIRILPFKTDGKSEADTLDVREFMDKGNTVAIPVGTRIVIQAVNRGTKKAYFNVIDLEPNGKINPVYPPIDGKTGLLKAQPDEFVLEPGQKKIFVCCTMTIGPPLGNEIFKVFATGTPIDLSSTINTRGAEIGTRGAGRTPLEKMMGNSFKTVSTRGAVADDTEVAEMGTNSFEYVFRITPKKP